MPVDAIDERAAFSDSFHHIQCAEIAECEAGSMRGKSCLPRYAWRTHLRSMQAKLPQDADVALVSQKQGEGMALSALCVGLSHGVMLARTLARKQYILLWRNAFCQDRTVCSASTTAMAPWIRMRHAVQFEARSAAICAFKTASASPPSGIRPSSTRSSSISPATSSSVMPYCARWSAVAGTEVPSRPQS